MNNWKCIADNQLWLNDNFLPDNMVNLILQSWKESAVHQEVAQKGMKYLVTPTNYHYNSVSNKITNYNLIQKTIITELNKLYIEIFDKNAPIDNLMYLQYFMKTSIPNVSFYDLHSEPSIDELENFGEAVFLYYLSDEIDGEIIFPNESDAQPYITPPYEETCKLIKVNYVEETISITPKRNRCLVLRTGIPHLVNVCSGNRHCIQGMSFAGDDYRNRWKTITND